MSEIFFETILLIVIFAGALLGYYIGKSGKNFDLI